MEISAQDLRIGNIINYLGVATIVESIAGIEQSYVATKSSGIMPINSFKPIPLTEEWLLKFGFESYDGEIYNPDFEYSEQFLYQLKSGISYREFRCFPSKGWIVKIGDYDDDLEIKYVHQLQNLYFALTGNELTIK